MSIIHCDGCDKRIDTDEDVDCYDSEGQAYCETCRAEHEADGLFLAQEHHRDLGWRGCTCQWIGANGDPDQHIKRDRNCLLHGRDPDVDRDAWQDSHND